MEEKYNTPVDLDTWDLQTFCWSPPDYLCNTTLRWLNLVTDGVGEHCPGPKGDRGLSKYEFALGKWADKICDWEKIDEQDFECADDRIPWRSRFAK